LRLFFQELTTSILTVQLVENPLMMLKRTITNIMEIGSAIGIVALNIRKLRRLS